MGIKKRHDIEVQQNGAGVGFCGTGYTERRGELSLQNLHNTARERNTNVNSQQLLTHNPKLLWRLNSIKTLLGCQPRQAV